MLIVGETVSYQSQITGLTFHFAVRRSGRRVQLLICGVHGQYCHSTCHRVHKYGYRKSSELWLSERVRVSGFLRIVHGSYRWTGCWNSNANDWRNVIVREREIDPQVKAQWSYVREKLVEFDDDDNIWPKFRSLNQKRVETEITVCTESVRYRSDTARGRTCFLSERTANACNRW